MTAKAVGRNAEIELKFSGSREDLQAAFLHAPGGPVRSAKLVSSYFDTPDGALAARELSLRVRKHGRRKEMTLKAGHARGLGRSEWTVPIDAAAPDVSLLPPDAGGLLDGVTTGSLAMIHCTEVARRTRLAEHGGATVELALDFGRIVAGGRDQPLAELELELKRGGPEGMLSLALEILSAVPLGLVARSKADRGQELASGAKPKALKSAQATYPANATVSQALAAFTRNAAAHATGNIAAIADAADPEGIHQMRVALRRLRSALALFKRQLGDAALEADAQARAALKRLGAARDLDVFCDETLSTIAAITPPAQQAAVEALAAAAAARRKAALAIAREVAAGPVLARLAVSLHALAEGGDFLREEGDAPVAEVAPAMLDRRFAKALKAGKGYAGLPWEQRHEVRIAVKKFRYALDFFSPLLPGKRAREFGERLSRLQDDMGLANDAHVAQELSAEIAAGDVMALRGAAFVAGWQARSLAAGEAELVAAWKSFRKLQPYWR